MNNTVSYNKFAGRFVGTSVSTAPAATELVGDTMTANVST